MIEVNGKLESNVLDGIGDVPKGRRYVEFVRVNMHPLKRFTDNGVKESYTSAVSIPMNFHTPLPLDPKAGNRTNYNIRYYENRSEQSVMGKSQVVYSPEFIDIEGKSLKLDMTKASDREKFKILMAHPMNESNSHLSHIKPVFRLFDSETLSRGKNEKERLINKAVAMVYDKSEVPNSLAEKIHRNLGRGTTDELLLAEDFDTIRFDIASFAKNKPEDFIKMVEDASLGLRAEIKEAVERVLIIQEKSQWLWGGISQAKNNRQICVIGVGEDPVQELIAFFVTDKKQGAKALALMRSELELAQTKQ